MTGIELGGTGSGGAGFPLSDVTPAEGYALLWDSAAQEYSPRKIVGGLNLAYGQPPVSTRALHPYDVSGSTALAGGQVQTRIRHYTLQDVHEMRLVFVNATSNNGLAFSIGTFTLECSVELPWPLFYHVTWNGAPTVTMYPGSIVVSDPIPVAIAGPNNANPTWAGAAFPYFWTRNLITFDSAGGRWPRIESINTGIGDGCEINLSGGLTNKIMSGTIGTADNQPFGPACIVGVTGSRLPVVAGVGDSIMIGQGDTPTVGTPGGYIMRQLYAGKIPTVRHGVSGQATTALSNCDTINSMNAGIYFMLPFLNGCTHAICEYGINDFAYGTATTVAQLQARWILAWSRLAARNPKVYQTTLTPATTSTDGWTTVANQTVTSYEALRTGANDWLRDGAPCASAAALTPVSIGTVGALRAGDVGHPLSGYFESADLAESARNSGKWKANYTSDGVHPNATGCVALMPAITLATFDV